jgi:hypothetical protein
MESWLYFCINKKKKIFLSRNYHKNRFFERVKLSCWMLVTIDAKRKANTSTLAVKGMVNYMCGVPISLSYLKLLVWKISNSNKIYKFALIWNLNLPQIKNFVVNLCLIFSRIKNDIIIDLVWKGILEGLEWFVYFLLKNMRFFPAFSFFSVHIMWTLLYKYSLIASSRNQ